MKRVFASVFCICAFIVVSSVPASAQYQNLGIEYVEAFDASITINKDSSLHVVENIRYNFGYLSKHGIYRDIPTVYPYDDDYERLIRLTDVSVKMDNGSVPIEQEGVDEGTRIRIGDADSTVSGIHTYTITYNVEGAMNAFDDHDELVWNVTGLGWTVPIAKATATVTAPATIQRSNCFAGPAGSQLSCDEQSQNGSTARFVGSSLGAGENLTFAIALPKGAVVVRKPILREIWSADKAFQVTPATLTGFGVLLLFAIGAPLYLWYRRGRDSVYQGGVVDAAMGAEGAPEMTKPMFAQPASPVQFTPPGELPPAVLTALVNEQVRSRDVAATVVDLARRGYLKITELSSKGLFRKADWQLEKLDADTTPLLTYERTLLSGLFEGTAITKLSDLRGSFATTNQSVKSEIYRQLTMRKFFRRSPRTVRTIYTALGIALTSLLVAVAVLGIWKTHAGLVFLALPITGIAFMFVARDMPARTAKGTAMYLQTVGFRKLFTDEEAKRAKFAENHNIFYEYLPYAIAFGLVDKWSDTFNALGAEQNFGTTAPLWYVPFADGHAFSATDFANSLDSFSVMSTGTLGASSGSSGFGGGGGGFSGGGFGGGGGGSW